MRIKAQIEPQRTRGNVTIVGSYRDRKSDKELYLLANGKKVVTSLEEKDRVFQHSFESGYPLMLSFDESDFADKTVIEFWKNHPLVRTEGHVNANFVSDQFVFEIKEERVKVEYDALNKKLKCVSQVASMSERERFDLAFALGSDPRDMSSKEVYILLIGLTLNGIAIARYDMVDTFLQVRVVERVATVYANKAVQYGIVKKEGSVYKIGGRNAGTTIEAVISFILADTEVFENYIKPEVDKIDAQEMHNITSLDLPKEISDLLPITGAVEKRAAKNSTARTKEQE
jgi:hypothetical protein